MPFACASGPSYSYQLTINHTASEQRRLVVGPGVTNGMVLSYMGKHGALGEVAMVGGCTYVGYSGECCKPASKYSTPAVMIVAIARIVVASW